MRGFKTEIFNQKTLEELYQKAFNTTGVEYRLTLTSKKQYTVWARSKFAGVGVDVTYNKAKKLPNSWIGVYKNASVYLSIAPKASKFNAQKVEADSYKFDSKSEYEYYLKLKNDPDVKITSVHPSFELMAGFRDNRGNWQRPIIYEADFSYYRGGVLYIVDVKGLLLPEFKIKWKLLLHKMGAIDPTIICMMVDGKGNEIGQPKPRKKTAA